MRMLKQRSTKIFVLSCSVLRPRSVPSSSPRSVRSCEGRGANKWENEQILYKIVPSLYDGKQEKFVYRRRSY